jgi:hypothetical protein
MGKGDASARGGLKYTPARGGLKYTPARGGLKYTWPRYGEGRAVQLQKRFPPSRAGTGAGGLGRSPAIWQGLAPKMDILYRGVFFARARRTGTLAPRPRRLRGAIRLRAAERHNSAHPHAK